VKRFISAKCVACTKQLQVSYRSKAYSLFLILTQRQLIALVNALDQRFVLTMVDLREQLNVMALDMERSRMILEFQEITGTSNLILLTALPLLS
jgi:hypothetical protein